MTLCIRLLRGGPRPIWDGPWAIVQEQETSTILNIFETRPSDINNKNAPWYIDQRNAEYPSGIIRLIQPVASIQPSKSNKILPGSHLIRRMGEFEEIANYAQGTGPAPVCKVLSVVPISANLWLVVYCDLQLPQSKDEGTLSEPSEGNWVPENLLFKRVTDLSCGGSHKLSKEERNLIKDHSDDLWVKAVSAHFQKQHFIAEFFVHWKGLIIDEKIGWWPEIDFRKSVPAEVPRGREEFSESHRKESIPKTGSENGFQCLISNPTKKVEKLLNFSLSKSSKKQTTADAGEAGKISAPGLSSLAEAVEPASSRAGQLDRDDAVSLPEPNQSPQNQYPVVPALVVYEQVAEELGSIVTLGEVVQKRKHEIEEVEELQLAKRGKNEDSISLVNIHRH